MSTSYKMKRLTGKMMEGRSLPIGYPIIAILKVLTLKQDNRLFTMGLPLEYCKHRTKKSMSHW